MEVKQEPRHRFDVEDFPEDFLDTSNDRLEAAKNIAAYEEAKAASALSQTSTIPDIYIKTEPPVSLDDYIDKEYQQSGPYILSQPNADLMYNHHRSINVYDRVDEVPAMNESSETEIEDEQEYHLPSVDQKKAPIVKRIKKEARAPLGNRNDTTASQQSTSSYQSRGVKRSISSSCDFLEEGPLNTQEIANRVTCTLRDLGIPQSVFAQKVLSRSQGTLSDLLRNPKTWDELKSGKETFMRMFAWLKFSEAEKLEIVNMETSAAHRAIGMPPPMPARGGSRRHDEENGVKRPRLVFTDIQKRTLAAIYKETQRPSRELQTTVCEHLNLDITTVSNYFMNARRRSRLNKEPVEKRYYPKKEKSQDMVKQEPEDF
uniref:One cut domain family member n=1 Tax=Caenorhabditis japonica TaxID=281687 RepID=A0A8R1DKS5_CAEJA